MSKLERIIHDNSNGLDYILVGEMPYTPFDRHIERVV